MPLNPTVPAAPSAPPAEEKAAARHRGITPPRLAPALQRRLHGVHAVKTLRTRLAATTGALLIAAIAGVALPAAAQPVQPAVAAVEPPAQSLSIAAVAATPIVPVVRDTYTAVSAPKPAAPVAKAPAVAMVAGLQYPLPLGSAVASGYGPRDCAACYSNFHHGMDIFPGAGTPVSAMASGTVSSASPSSSGAMGVSVTISHTIGGQLVTSVYGHFQAGSMTLSVGDSVGVGQVIGLVGATGNAQGPHLHFEIHPGGGDSVDPYAWIAARIG
ncbi:M23 family metallopeptidase [Salinibacterium hongtaonis]|uniref:M23 family metallopeptidase n=1 Tax=Homoserinimonas hongtaonis TaxID=2079791 RepID=UPI00131EEE56|nr:M23 family metallopeptidase [Salinibacterium hongtaonis]